MNRFIFSFLRRPLWNASLVAIALSLPLVQVALALSGALDATFSGDGRVATTIVAGQPSQPYGLAIQPDGRIVAVGETWRSSSNSNIAIARYTPAGALDTSFNSTGRRAIDLGASELGLGVAINPNDGKIVIAGSKCTGVGCDLVVMRFNTTGTLDTTFGASGKRVDDYGGGNNGGSPGIAIQPDGGIVVAGYMFNTIAQDYNFAVYRYTSAGRPDTTFSADGKQSIAFGAGRRDFASALALQPDGKILVGGESCDYLGGSCNFALARLNPNGSTDATFHTTGRLTTDFGGDDRAYGLALQADGRIILVGVKYTASTSFFALVRYTPTGALDGTFGTSGKKILDFSASASPDSARSVVVQPDGKIVVCGTAFGTTGGNFALARFTNTGALDLTFSGDGKAAVNFGYDDGCSSLALQSDGKYVLAGYTDNGSIRKFALARVLP